MSHTVAGDQIVDYITHTGHDGLPLAGKTFTVVTARDPLGNPFTPTITEVGGGSYKLVIQTQRTLPGTWYLLVADLSLSPAKYYDGSWDADVAPTEPTSDGVDGTSRLTIRRTVGRLLGDMVLLKATSDGTTSTFVDDVNLHYQDGALNGRQILLVSCGNVANEGVVRRVTGNLKSNGSVSFTPGSPAPTLAGDEAELWNERGSTITVDEVHEAINRAIRAAAATTVSPVSQTVTLSLNQLQPVLDIPAGWEYFSRAQWQDISFRWRQIPTSDLRIDQANMQVEIMHRSKVLAHKRAIRFFGYVSPGVLESDTDVTPVDPEWIGYYAANQLLVASAHRQSDSSAALSKASWFGDQADRVRPKTRIRPIGRFVRLR